MIACAFSHSQIFSTIPLPEYDLFNPDLRMQN